MAVIEETITRTICDICGDDTGNFHYYETHTNVFGVIAEMSFWIDTCEECTKAFQYSIPEEIYRDRYDSEEDMPSEDIINSVVDELKDIVEHNKSRQEYFFTEWHLKEGNHERFRMDD